MAAEVFDVVLLSTGVYLGNFQDWQDFPPPQANFSLGTEFWIGRLPHNIDSETVFDTCEPAGYEFRPIRQFGCRYAVCRKVCPPSLGPEHYGWDHEGIISRTLFLSRLIHPTTIASHYSARLFFEDGSLAMVVPGGESKDMALMSGSLPQNGEIGSVSKKRNNFAISCQPILSTLESGSAARAVI
jgi:hypothetical protein